MTFDPRIDPAGFVILKAFGATQDDPTIWRSSSGVARDLEMSTEEVEIYLQDHLAYFEEFPFRPGGVTLYRARRDIVPRSE